jgi:YebC/PmpR family DNA-binding regulatory protein
MSGHNKWSKIKHKKAATDAQKSKIFSKHSSLITIESRNANGDVNSPGLKAAIERAKKDSMPASNIERAVKKGTGGEAGAMEALTYEAYGPGGTALMIDTITDNRNRTAAEIKHLLSKQGLSIAEPGAAAWAFEKDSEMHWQPKTTIPVEESDEEKLNSIIEAIEEHDDVQGVYTNAE